MATIVGVKFKSGGKLYYFEPNDQPLLMGTQVIVETARGLECGEVVLERKEVPDDQINHELKKIVREATEADRRRMEDNKKKEVVAFGVCEEKIALHDLKMKLVSVEYAFDGSKILYNFTADGRVDFRELVRDLASVFRTRIEMRQIGIRDEAKILGGLGVCGRPFCCATYMGDFQPVSIKMAKEQGLSLNPVKISGACGRLMCCLKYEQESYEDLQRRTPRAGSIVSTSDGEGVITDVNLLTGRLTVHLNDSPEGMTHTYHKRDVKVLVGKQPEYDPDDERTDDDVLSLLDEPEQPAPKPERPERQNARGEGRNQNRPRKQEHQSGDHQSGQKPSGQKPHGNKQPGPGGKPNQKKPGGGPNQKKPGGKNFYQKNKKPSGQRRPQQAQRREMEEQD